jgi:hypothetical protein
MNTLLNRVAVLTLALVLNGGQQQPSATPRSGAQLRNLVHDPKIADSSSTPSPIPSDTPYSEWAVNGSSYVVAYRNADKGDPNDIVADIYFKNAQDSGLRKIISVPVFSQVDDVKLVSVAGDSSSQLAFFRSSGQQQWLAIVALKGPSAHKVFDYGARWIKLTEDKPPKILAHSHPDDTTETFEWCASKRKIVLESACGQRH